MFTCQSKVAQIIRKQAITTLQQDLGRHLPILEAEILGKAFQRWTQQKETTAIYLLQWTILMTNMKENLTQKLQQTIQQQEK